MYNNKEGYPDPTAGAALKHVEYEEHLKNRRSSKASWFEVTKNAAISHYSCEENSLNERYLLRAEPYKDY